MKFLKFVLSVLFLFSIQISTAQYHFPDSIKTNQEKAIFLDYKIIKTRNLDSAFSFVTQAIFFAKKSNNDSLYAALLSRKAKVIFFKSDYKKAIEELKKLTVFSISKNLKYYEYLSYSILGKAHIMIRRNDLAISYYKKSIDAAIQIKDSLILGDAYNNLGDCYKSVDMPQKSKFFFLKALKIYNQIKADENEKITVYKNLARVSEDYDKVIFYLNKAQNILKKENNSRKLGSFYLSKGFTLLNKKHFKEAIISLKKALKYTDITKNNFNKTLSLIELGYCYNRLKKYDKALVYLEDASKFHQSDNTNYILLLEELALAYHKKREYKKAYDTFLVSKKYSDSIAKHEAIEKFAEFEVKFRTQEKNKEIATQQLEIATQKNTKNTIIITSLLSLLLLITLFQWLYNKQKRRKNDTENELQKEQEINDLRTKFLGNIAHEIRTPLTLISGNLHLALENLENIKKVKQNIHIALTNSKKVVEDANEILELLKFEKSKVTIKLTTVNLDNILKRIFYSFNSLATFKKIELVYQSLVPNNYLTNIDVEKVEKILNNLISNAIKYSPSNAKIFLYVTVKEDKLILKVTDFGQGIHFDETEKIFQRFYQASNSKSVGGIGIGLSLAREFAALLNGTLTVKSTLKKGSTFTFTLPLTKATNNTLNIERDFIPIETKQSNKKEKENQQNINITINNKKPSILIVEDNPEMSNYLVEILSNNYICSTAFDGLEALEKVRNTTFDLITSDIMMPNLNGFEFREALNKNKIYKNIPFILISAKTLTEDKIKGFKLGIDDYIIKPFNKNELIARINNLINNKVARKQWKINNKELFKEEEAYDTKLIAKIERIIIKNISNEEYKITQLATEIGYSQRQLVRLLNQYTGMSAVKFILEIRLQKAYHLLQQKSLYTLSEVKYDVGISSTTYFNKKFKERFGINPSELLKS